MVPVNLKLSNFTSFSENPPELDFTKFKLAAISGLNGAGKSSLLDAITWCIWGNSRSGESSDVLIHMGADNMQVEFSFELDGHLYTVKRRRSKKGGGSTALEFWSGSPLHNLTEGTIKATQEKIIQTLHLTFETFTSSSYLRQGHADEFTTKGPTERKRILTEILRLDHYDLLEEKAKEKAKDAQTNLSLLDYQLLEIEAELSQKEDREKKLSVAEQEAKKVKADLQECEELIKKIQFKHQTIISAIKSFEEKKIQIEKIEKDLTDFKLLISLNEKAKGEFEDILKQKITIEENYQKLQKLQQEKSNLETKRSQLIKVKDELAAVQKILISREEKRQIAIKVIEIELKKLETENEQIQTQINHLNLNQQTCPTCGQMIGKDKNEQILLKNKDSINKNEVQILKLKEKLQKYQSVVLPEESKVNYLEKEVKILEEQTKHWTKIRDQILQLDNYQNLFIKLAQAETGVKTHQEAILDLKKIYDIKVKHLTSGQKELEQLLIFENKLKEVQKRLIAQETIRIELSQKALELERQFGEAKQLVSRTKQLEQLASQKHQQKSKLQKEKQIFEQLALAFGKKGIQAMIIETAIPEIEDEANKLLDNLTEGRMKVSLQTQRETKTKLESGEKGIVETLDINISDEMGKRPYELFSGGEEFRVNFAIRLAISKLLTQRAGAKLQFLVIDEGFGSQDAPGRARLIESIDAIKDDFEKILIVTHIEELKDEFPVRIEVSKNSTGSTFEMVGE
ncbi:SMC family ATPase [Candidatus Daviesbacteria bacterium]|nr:SMC family ATPase [Candidatus Daviesbacteria bacterium]